jgi:hypothetical protein
LRRGNGALGKISSVEYAAAAELADQISDHEYRALIADRLDSVSRPRQ